jgi:hypothetical protein
MDECILVLHMADAETQHVPQGLHGGFRFGRVIQIHSCKLSEGIAQAGAQALVDIVIEVDAVWSGLLTLVRSELAHDDLLAIVGR